MFIFERQIQSVSRGGAERERETERDRERQRETQKLKQPPGSELSAQSLMWGSNS